MLPDKLCSFLRQHGYDGLHVEIDFIHLHPIDDKEIRAIANQRDRIIITKDNDFKKQYQLKGAPPKVLFIDLGNIRNSMLMGYFTDYLNEIITYFKQGHAFVTLAEEGVILPGNS